MEETLTKGEVLVKELMKIAAEYGPKVVGAIITLVVGLWVIRRITKLAEKNLKRSNIDNTLVPFIRNMINLGLKVLLIISVAGIVGIQTTSFIAVLGAAGLAVGMALQGSLANFAGGVLILIFRPFKVDDVIKAQGYTGKVKEILLFATVIKTFDNQVIYLPNGPLAGGAIQNLTQEPTRRVDITFGIGYSDDIDKAKETLREVVDSIPEIFKDPKADIVMTELADSSVNFAVRSWCKTEDYWTVHTKCLEQVKKAFDAKGISIPFPQRDVHLHQVQ